MQQHGHHLGGHAAISIGLWYPCRTICKKHGEDIEQKGHRAVSSELRLHKVPSHCAVSYKSFMLFTLALQATTGMGNTTTHE
jgi:hypothetical protein